MKTQARPNPKKDRSARRPRPVYPDSTDFQFVPGVNGRPSRFIALRSDGAVITRKSPDMRAHAITVAKSRKILREENAKHQTTLFNDPKFLS